MDYSDFVITRVQRDFASLPKREVSLIAVGHGAQCSGPQQLRGWSCKNTDTAIEPIKRNFEYKHYESPENNTSSASNVIVSKIVSSDDPGIFTGRARLHVTWWRMTVRNPRVEGDAPCSITSLQAPHSFERRVISNLVCLCANLGPDDLIYNPLTPWKCVAFLSPSSPISPCHV